MKDKMKNGIMGSVSMYYAAMPMITEDDNDKNKERATRDWNYGADAKTLAKVWDVAVEDAEKMFCGNCEYYCNRPSTLEAIKDVVESVAEAGMCNKHNFACSYAASCQAWEEKPMNKDKEY